MDLQTMRLRLERGKYQTRSTFYQDLELIVSNSRKYHHHNEDFLTLTKKFENLCLKLQRKYDPQQKKKHQKSSTVNKHSKKVQKKIEKIELTIDCY